MKPYVYRLNHPSGKFYIGYRWKNKLAASDDLGKIYFSSSKDPLIREHFDEFEQVIIAEFDDRDTAFAEEQRLIELFWGDPNLINKSHQQSGKFRCDGHTEQTRSKMSAAKKGKPPNNKGKKMSDANLAKLSERAKAQVHTLERRAKMSALRLGNTFGLGNKSRTGQKRSEAERLKTSITLKGREGWKPTVEQKNHLSEIAKARPRFTCLTCKRTLVASYFTRHLLSHHE